MQLDVELVLGFYPKLSAAVDNAFAANLSQDKKRPYEELRTLLDHLRKYHFRDTLDTISSLFRSGEITYDLLYTIYVPGATVVTQCPVTQELRAWRVLSWRPGDEYGKLSCECLQTAVNAGGESYWSRQESPSSAAPSFTWHRTTFNVDSFVGVQRMVDLDFYPIKFHNSPKTLKDQLIERGRRWARLIGVHHVYYNGTAAYAPLGERISKITVDSRIVLDKETFIKKQPGYGVPNATPNRMIVARDRVHKTSDDLSDDALLHASPVVYGYSLSDKLWLEFNVARVEEIQWNETSFKDLVLPAARKDLLLSLLQTHSQRNSEHDSPAHFDDIVSGKGQGLVINLYGPPGVGKTLSAEVTSEHLKRPLYIVGSGDLGTSPETLQSALKDIFDLAATWNAVLLIDEADVFLEQRSSRDMHRNAMISVFLRHIEYYRGVLFLTTNRVDAFDKAFISRIHVSLHFDELTVDAKKQIWTAFLAKASASGPVSPSSTMFSSKAINRLAQHKINGRQIKNVCKIAASLAVSRKEELCLDHVEVALESVYQGPIGRRRGLLGKLGRMLHVSVAL